MFLLYCYLDWVRQRQIIACLSPVLLIAATSQSTGFSPQVTTRAQPLRATRPLDLATLPFLVFQLLFFPFCSFVLVLLPGACLVLLGRGPPWDIYREADAPKVV